MSCHVTSDGFQAGKEAIVVGIYGVSGCGKTHLLQKLKEILGEDQFLFYEGSEVLSNISPGGLNGFQMLEEQCKMHWRAKAIDSIKQECVELDRVAVVTGHFMFWDEKEAIGTPIYTQNDLETFTHILYLDVPAATVAQRRRDDTAKARVPTSVGHIQRWQQAEKAQLRDLCLNHAILFMSATKDSTLAKRISTLLLDFRPHTETYNTFRAQRSLEEAINCNQSRLETVLVLDGDKTLSAEDSGALFWERVCNSSSLLEEQNPLKRIFGSSMGYSYTAFRQAVLLYEETANDEEFDDLCQNIASAMTMYPDFVHLLAEITKQDHLGAVIVTCGLRCVWEKILEREGLAAKVKVIGGGRLADGFVVTAAVKAALVERLRFHYNFYVLAFGDSPLDLNMLCKANEAIVVVGEEHARSRTMESALAKAIATKSLQARQALIPQEVPPRLSTMELPLVHLRDEGFIASVLRHRGAYDSFQVFHATDDGATKLLMTSMRNALISGAELRRYHQHVGWYLTMRYLVDIIGTEEYQVPHVQGHHTIGHRFHQERDIAIVALMRGGEPMALGVSNALPTAMFVHAAKRPDLTPEHLKGKHAVVLVDSVVNSGKTIVQFVQHIQNIDDRIRIVVLTGVAQEDVVSRWIVDRSVRFSLVALRLSENKFTGKGTTDTGNRLFNTTHLD